MKKSLFSFVAIALFMLAMVSCQTETTNRYQHAIPANISGVLSIRLQQMADKAQLSETTKAQILQILKDGMKSQNTEKLEKIFKNPEESGISLEAPVIAFFEMPKGIGVTGKGTSASSVYFNSSKNQGLVAKPLSTSKLDDLFATMKNEGVPVSSVKKDGYTEVVIENLVCTYNSESLLILFNTGNLTEIQEQAAAYMTQNESQSALSNKYFKKAIENHSDLSVGISMANYPDLLQTASSIKNMSAFAFIQDSTLWKDIYVMGVLNFENGKVHADMSYDSDNKTALDKFQQITFIGQKQSNTFLNRFPASTLYYVGTSIDGTKLYELIAQQLHSLPSDIDQDKLKQLITAIDGDFSFGLTKLGMMNIPSVLFYVEVKDNYPLTYIQEQLKGQVNFIPNGDNAVKGIIPMLNMTIYMGIQKGQFYFTNDAEIYSRIDKTADNPLGNSPQGKNLKNSYSCAFVNFSAINQLPVIQMLLSKAGPQTNIMKNILGGIDYFEAYAPGQTEGVWNFFLTDKTQNSLKVITSGAEQLLPLISK